MTAKKVWRRKITLAAITGVAAGGQDFFDGDVFDHDRIRGSGCQIKFSARVSR